MAIKHEKISDDELENVSGGCTEDRMYPGDKSKYADYTVPVNKYCGVIGTRYLFEKIGDSKEWLFGKLVNTYEADHGAYSFRTHDIFVEDGSGSAIGGFYNNTISVSKDGTKEIGGDDYQMYAKS